MTSERIGSDERPVAFSRSAGEGESGSDRSRASDAENGTENGSANECRCTVEFYGEQLVIDAEHCPGNGRLVDRPACRETVIDALAGRDVVAICTRFDDTERAYGRGPTAFLLAAGRFVSLCNPHDEGLAARAKRDPFMAARLAAARGAPLGRIAAETGFIEGTFRYGSYQEAFGANRGRERSASRRFRQDGWRRHSARVIGPDLYAEMESGVVFHEVSDAGELSPEALRRRYDEQLVAVIDEHGINGVVDATTVGRETVEGIAADETPTLTLEEGAAILALDPAEPDAEAIAIETRDHLLLGMTTGVLDVEAVESGIDGAFDAREIQQKIEGRLRMTLDELAQLHSYIDSRGP